MISNNRKLAIFAVLAGAVFVIYFLFYSDGEFRTQFMNYTITLNFNAKKKTKTERNNSTIYSENKKNRSRNTNDTELGITRIVHQSWKYIQDLPPYFQRHIPSWKKCFPKWEYKFWTDEDNRNLIMRHYSWFLPKYDAFPHGIYRADCARYFYMFHYGGIYTDLDNECLRPFEDLLVNHSLVFGDINHVPKVTKLKNENYVQNSFMYSKPNNPFWLELLLDIFHSTTISTADITTGPTVLCNMIQKFKDRSPFSKELKIYEAKYFNPITWGNKAANYKPCKIYNTMTEIEYQQCKKFHYDKGSYVLQYHTHTWG